VLLKSETSWWAGWRHIAFPDAVQSAERQGAGEETNKHRLESLAIALASPGSAGGSPPA